MKLWVDDVRLAPGGYVWCKNVNEAIETIKLTEYICNGFGRKSVIELIDLSHDAGDYTNDEYDYISILNWLEETGRSYPIRIHSMNPVGVENMRRIIQRNGWTEVK